MSGLLTIVVLCCYLYFLRDYRWYSPAHTFAIVSLANLLVFYVTIGLGVLPSEYDPHALSWRYANASLYEAHLFTTCLTLAIITLIAISADVYANRTTSIGGGPVSPAQAFRGIALTLNSERGIFVILVLMTLIWIGVVMHVVTGGLEAAIKPHLYRYAKSPEYAGLSNPIAILIHQRGDLLMLVSLMTLIAAIYSNNFLLAIVSLPLIAYFATLEMLLSSRSVSLAFFISCAVSLVLFRRGRRLILGGLFSTIALFAYILALAGRRDGIAGADTILRAAGHLSLDLNDLFWSMLVNPFSAGHRIAYSFGRPVDFPFSYQILSFSPLPSAIDGFNAVRHFAAPINGNRWMPLGAYGEVIQFNPLIIILGTLVLLFTLTYLAKAVRRMGGVAALIVFFATFIPIMAIPVYHIRGYGRFLIAITLAIAAINMITSRRKQRRTLRTASATASAHNPRV